ncbi:hypothetical protein VHEMI04103 [[Torrubiella] hemipterigena]|uniref:Uncharacterized protein n=1 Tax=[Torrubiella] hemipterigena TaxID=1531966 RepID=A0A0A1TDC5_9HYPO|nr:hypothetical protein VHEMI04103 [[Torrubiella] hemipterigena]
MQFSLLSAAIAVVGFVAAAPLPNADVIARDDSGPYAPGSQDPKTALGSLLKDLHLDHANNILSGTVGQLVHRGYSSSHSHSSSSSSSSHSSSSSSSSNGSSSSSSSSSCNGGQCTSSSSANPPPPANSPTPANPPTPTTSDSTRPSPSDGGAVAMGF